MLQKAYTNQEHPEGLLDWFGTCLAIQEFYGEISVERLQPGLWFLGRLDLPKEDKYFGESILKKHEIKKQRNRIDQCSASIHPRLSSLHLRSDVARLVDATLTVHICSYSIASLTFTWLYRRQHIDLTQSKLALCHLSLVSLSLSPARLLACSLLSHLSSTPIETVTLYLNILASTCYLNVRSHPKI